MIRAGQVVYKNPNGYLSDLQKNTNSKLNKENDYEVPIDRQQFVYR